MNRRSYLRAGAAMAAGASTAGCLGGLFDSGPQNVVLSPPDDQLADSSSLAYPAYGESFPAFTLPNPFAEEPFSVADFEQPFLCTAFYAFCPAECILLLNSFAKVQARLLEQNRADEIGLIAITFDPERDTPEALRTNADRRGINYEHPMWYYLRPESADAAKQVVEEKLGLAYEKIGDVNGDAYEFNHISVTFLVNPDGMVERAYRGQQPDVERLVDDSLTVQDAYSQDT
ncbi:SCO family protein [Halonotius aquaticus]|uniref:SCO family protein n=1 Tax=Halonotius aquaticus TaxID=2216978 RepID=A0A3A6PJ23_9EURY|nr:SCO family protein [Halonotius aquaticus]RJX41964.1 SCO family protein [Halonotius aquaticus]